METQAYRNREKIEMGLVRIILGTESITTPERSWKQFLFWIAMGVFLFCATGTQVVSAYTLSVSVTSATQGYLIQSPQQADYPDGTTVTLYASARQGYRFTGWTGDLPEGQEMSNPLVFALNRETTLTATFGLTPSGTIRAWGNIWDCTSWVSAAPPDSNNSGFVSLAAGESHCLGLKADGSIAGWGSFYDGSIFVPVVLPSPNSDFMAVSAGFSHCLALKSDGSILAWGTISNGTGWVAAEAPSSNSDFVAISAGDAHNLALKSDGSVVAWGWNAYGQCDVPQPNRDFVAIAAGGTGSLGLKSDGSIVTWGSISEVPSPNTGFIAVSKGKAFSLGLKSNGSIVAWGMNDLGQCVVPSPNSGFVAISAGADHSLGLKSDGSIVAWGNNYEGQYGVPILNRCFVAVEAGQKYSLMIVLEGSLQVNLVPSEAMAVGAQWRLTSETDGVWHNSGTVSYFPIGRDYTIEYRMLGGWQEPRNRTVSIEKDQLTTVTAVYRSVPTCSLTTSATLGYVISAPERPDYPVGMRVKLFPRGYPGYQFSGWQGDVPAGQEKANPLLVTMDSSKTLTATFEPVPGGVVTVWGDKNIGELSVPFTASHFIAVSAGGSHCLGLKSDGSVATWGNNVNGQCSLPEQNDCFVAISAGWKHSLGLKSDGSIVAWGRHFEGQSYVPEPNSDFVDVSAGAYHSLGLKSDGSIVAWGDNGYNQCAVPLPNKGFVAIAAGTYHSLGLKSDGSIVAWGLNNVEGQSGLYTGQCNVPLPNIGFVAIEVGEYHSLGLKSDGSIVVWGKIWNGSDYVSAASPSPNRNFVALASGYNHSLGLKSDGSLVAWGGNAYGQCTVPFPNSGFVAVAAGGSQSLALGIEGTLQVTINPSEAVTAGAQWRVTDEADGVWHDSGTSQSLRTGENYTVEYKVLAGWQEPTSQTVSIGENTQTSLTGVYQAVPTCSLVTTSTHGYVIPVPGRPDYPVGMPVKLFPQAYQGYRFSGWMGDVPVGRETDNPLTLTIDTSKTLVAIFEAVPSGMVVAWGSDFLRESTISFPNNDFVAVAAGGSHSLGLKSNGSIEVWGSRESGLGSVPAPNSGFVAVAAGDVHSLGLKSDGSIVAWGNNRAGQCSVPVPNSGFVAVAARGSRSLGLKSDGSIVAWGNNDFGQGAVPLPNSGFVALAAGENHSLGLKSDGSIVTWGDNQSGQCDVPVSNRGFIVIAAGDQHSLGLKSDGSLVAWGQNLYGECAVSTFDRGFVALAGGWRHSLGLKSDGSIMALGDNSCSQCIVPSPNRDFVAVVAGDTHSLAIVPIGSLQVTLSPPRAIAAGARWRLTSEAEGVWHDETVYDPVTKSSSTVLEKRVGTYTLTFKEVAGWSKPVDQRVELTTSGTTRVVGNYRVAWPLSTVCQNGTVLVSPAGTHFPDGTQVTLTAIPDSGYQFAGWTGDATSSTNPLVVTMDSTKTLTANFEIYPYLFDPQNVTAVGNTYQVRVGWDSVTSATAYGVKRIIVDTTDTTTVKWTVGAVTEFADDTAVPSVTYAYQVTAIDSQGQPGTPSEAATATVTPETFTPATYKVMAKGYTMERNIPTADSLTFTPTVPGSTAGTIKITRLTKVPASLTEDPIKGIYYLTNQSQAPLLRIEGDVKTLAFDVPVNLLEVMGSVNALQAKDGVTFIQVGEMASAKIAATRPMESGQYARTFIETNGSTPLTLQATGVVVESLGSASGARQPVKLLSVASKSYKNSVGLTKTSLGAIGSLPKVVAEVAGTPAPQSEATPCSIQGSMLKSVTVSGGPLVADELVGAIDKVTVAGGNLRCGLIQSSKDLVLIQATAKKVNGVLVGGAVGTAGSATEMVVKGQPNTKKVAIGKVSAQTGISGFFYAGYDAATGLPTQSGGIAILQAKTGVVEGAAFLDPALVSKMKVLPKTPAQPIEINP